MNHTKIRLLALLFVPFSLFSQQEPAVTQFWNTYLYSNPATAGLFNCVAVNGLYRNQWVGVTGAPVDLFVNGSARIDGIHGGIGLSYAYDDSGYNKDQTTMANYSYHFNLSEGRKLAVGLAAGIKQAHFVSDYLIPPVTMKDVALPTVAMTAFDVNFGLAYSDSNFRAGISVTNINHPSLRSNGIEYHISRNYWAFAEYDFHLRKVTLTPRIGGITDFNKLTFSASLMTMINNRFWFGANYMYENSVGAMAGVDLYGKYRIGYSYDYTINKLNPYSKGTHEIVLAFLLR